MQSDIEALHREACRQFDLGHSNVAANTRFLQLFRRYIELAADPLLALDLHDEAATPQPIRRGSIRRATCSLS